MPTIPEMLNDAVRYHQSGHLQAAADLYRQVLKMDPNQIDALHLLGVIAGQTKNEEVAVELIGKAISLRPDFPEAHKNLGLVLKKQNRLDEAIKQYRHAQSLAPRDPEVLNLLANALSANEEHEEAVATFKQALEIKPIYPEAYANLGIALKNSGQLEEAVASCRKAVELKPGYANAHNALGAALQALGDLEAAVMSYRQSLQIKSDETEVHYNLATALEAQGKHAEAAAHARQALQIKPDYIKARVTLVAALRGMRKFDEAAETCRLAIELEPDNPKLYCALGSVLQEKGDSAEATEQFQRALEIEPSQLDALYGYGHALAIQGKHDEAIVKFRQLLETAPDHPQTLESLAHCLEHTTDEPGRVEEMEKLLSQGRLTSTDQCSLHFALGKIYDDTEDWDKAFHHYRAANDLADVVFDKENLVRFVDKTIENCGPSLLERGPELGVASDRPVFIVGMPRSGTTLIEQILCSHPDIHGAGELEDMTKLVEKLKTDKRLQRPYPDGIDGIDAELATELGNQYLRRIDEENPDTARVTDKMPGNCMHLGLIALILPQARIIHARRDPYDTCLSCFFKDFKARAGLSFAFDLAGLGEYYSQYLRLMNHWREILPLPLFEVNYEELVADQATVSRQLVEFCGLDWDPACLDFHQTERSVRTASNWQVRQPIYTRSVARWKNYEKYLQPLKERLDWHPRRELAPIKDRSNPD